MFDPYTWRQLEDLYRDTAARESAAYVAKALWRDQHPETGALNHPDYAILAAAADEACEMRRALHAELTRREAVNA